MIFFSVGLPSRFAEWCDSVAAHLVQQALGSVGAVYADTVEQFALAVVKLHVPYAVVASRQTVGRLWATLAQANSGFIVALDDPRLALENLVVRHGTDFVEATRVVARSCASMVSCAPLSGALVLHADRSEADPVATAAAIAQHFELHVGENDITSILANIGVWPDGSRNDAWWSHLEEPQRMLAAAALDPYLKRFAGEHLDPITWGRELFHIHEERDVGGWQPALRPVDITGRPRSILHGPSISLPPGSWSASIALGFSEEAAEMSFILELCADTQLVQMKLQPAGERFLEVSLDFSIPEPQLIVVRLQNERAAFDGRLALGHVTITSHKSMQPETRNYLVNALSE